MKLNFYLAALCAMLASAASAQSPAPEQLWVGHYTIGGQSTAMVLHDRSPAPRSPSVLDIPAQGARDLPLAKFSKHAGGVHFEMQGGPGLFIFDGKVRGSGLAGSVTQGSARGKFTLVPVQPMDLALNRSLSGSYQLAPDRVIDIGMMSEIGGQLVFLDHKTLREGPLQPLSSSRFVSGPTIGIPYPFAIDVDFTRNAAGAVTGLRWKEGGRILSARKVAPHRVEQVTIVNDGITLKGTLAIPDKPGPHPAVVFAHGSGPSLRDVGPWNMFFLRQGMAVLSLDKRGAGESGGDWRTASMQDIAGDWLAGVAMLRQRADIDPARIGVHGSSQGGWTAPMMAVRSPGVAWIIVRAGSAATVSDTMVHEIGWTVREAGLPETDAREAQDAARRLFAMSSAPWDEFEAFATPLKEKPWAPHVWALHQTKSGWGRAWNAKNAPYDPADTLAKVQVPVLWFLGKLDHNLPSIDSARLLDAARARSGHQDFTVVMIPDAGHSFLASSTGNNSEFPFKAHMAAGYWSEMESWLRQRAFSRP